MIADFWYEMHLSTRDCRYEARLNGVPVHTGDRPLPTEARFPVNHWLRSGENMLELVLPDIDDPLPESASVVISLLLGSKGTETNTGLIICRLAWRQDLKHTGNPVIGSSKAGVFDSNKNMAPDADGDVRVGQVQVRQSSEGLSLRRQVLLNTGLPDWAWQTISPYEINPLDQGQLRNLHQSLWREISRVYAYLRQGRPEPVADLCEERSRELDLAFGHPVGTTRGRLLTTLAAALHDPDLSLAPVTERQLGLDPWPNNRLIRMVRADFTPALAFVSRSMEFSHAIDLVFRPDPDGWVICR